MKFRARPPSRTGGSICRPAPPCIAWRRRCQAGGRSAAAAGAGIERDRGHDSGPAADCPLRSAGQTGRIAAVPGPCSTTHADNCSKKRRHSFPSRERRRSTKRASSPQPTPSSFRRHRLGQGRRPVGPGADADRAAAALDIRLCRWAGAGHLDRRPLPPPFATSTARR